MLVEPALSTWRATVAAADQCAYLPYTNTEQDVLEVPRGMVGMLGPSDSS